MALERPTRFKGPVENEYEFWEAEDYTRYVKDEKVFLFSLTANKIYPIYANKEVWIRQHENFGPLFSCDSPQMLFDICDKCHQDKFSVVYGLSNLFEEAYESLFIGYDSNLDNHYVEFFIDDYEIYEVE